MDANEPRIEVRLTYDELALAAGVRPAVLARLIRLGVIEPERPDADAFPVSTLARLRRMLRLQAQLGVNFTGAAIILDLLDRLQRLERGAASKVEGSTDPGRLSSSSQHGHAAPRAPRL
jgi:chaperone modulatory protein CbpM